MLNKDTTYMYTKLHREKKMVTIKMVSCFCNLHVKEDCLRDKSFEQKQSGIKSHQQFGGKKKIIIIFLHVEFMKLIMIKL